MVVMAPQTAILVTSVEVVEVVAEVVQGQYLVELVEAELFL
jgi:hypothetical protein